MRNIATKTGNGSISTTCKIDPADPSIGKPITAGRVTARAVLKNNFAILAGIRITSARIARAVSAYFALDAVDGVHTCKLVQIVRRINPSATDVV